MSQFLAGETALASPEAREIFCRHAAAYRKPCLFLVLHIGEPSRACSPILQADKMWGYSVKTSV